MDGSSEYIGQGQAAMLLLGIFAVICVAVWLTLKWRRFQERRNSRRGPTGKIDITRPQP